jgi:hypothetical protein
VSFIAYSDFAAVGKNQRRVTHIAVLFQRRHHGRIRSAAVPAIVIDKPDDMQPGVGRAEGKAGRDIIKAAANDGKRIDRVGQERDGNEKHDVKQTPDNHETSNQCALFKKAV